MVIVSTLPPQLELSSLNLVNSENIFHDLTPDHNLLAEVDIRNHKHHDHNIDEYPVVKEWPIVETMSLASCHVDSGKDS